MDTKNSEKKTTPMMEQWKTCKQKSGDAILLFRLGDFYEAFHEDAEIISTALELTLTQRQGIPMSGIPHHAADGYIDRLIGKGFKVAVAEQMGSSDPDTKQPMKRDIVRIVTPGTLLSSGLLVEKTNNYIVALTQLGQIFGMASLDITTGSLEVAEYEYFKDLLNTLYDLQPAEILVSQKFATKRTDIIEEIKKNIVPIISFYKDWHFEHQIAYNFLTQHFKVANLEGFGLKGFLGGIEAAGGLLSYIKNELFLPIDHISRLSQKNHKEFLVIDRTSHINLELVKSLHDSKDSLSLLHIIDKTLTPMGGRLLRSSLNKPLLSIETIESRQEAVSFFYHLNELRSKVRSHLRSIRDIERLINKILTNYASPRDVLALGISLKHFVALSQSLAKTIPPRILNNYLCNTEDIESMSSLILESLVENPPLKTIEGGIFANHYSQDLQKIRNDLHHREEWISNYQETLRKETNNKKLKVSYNNILGYYIEISGSRNPNLPSSFIHKQTRSNAERYISKELKEFESYILSAREQSSLLEENLFKDFCSKIIEKKGPILKSAHATGLIDFFCSLSETARLNDYVKPTITPEPILKIINGRHPVVEKAMPKEQFVANDIDLDGSTRQMMLITGPNMAGKSTYIRQNALIVIMAQIGSFVPAEVAEIGIVDKIFTRIGAGDNLSKGMSTFMVEMVETANILNNTTDHSLVILDEIGRGTGTYDGLAIAQAVIEYLMETRGKKSKTLFATHYRELIPLEKTFSGLLNYHAEVSDLENGPIFLHKIIRGCAEKSYGVHIAKIAGFPLSVVSRAQELLSKWELNKDNICKITSKAKESRQLTLF